MGIIKKSANNKYWRGEDVEKREPFQTVGGNANGYNHYGEQNEGSLTNYKESCHMIQQSYSWACIWEKQKL